MGWVFLACAGGSQLEGPRTPAASDPVEAAEVTTGSEAGTSDSSARADSEPQPAVAEPQPAEGEQARAMLQFFEIGVGDRIADLGAGSGYSIQALAQAVGRTGVVYARHDPRPASDLPSESGAEAAPPANVVRMRTPDDAPFSAEAKDLDLVTLLFSYHEYVARGVDREKLNRAVFRALEPGRFYVIADHAAPPGSGLGAARQLNRIEESIVRAEVEAAGFVFVESADFLSQAARTRPAGSSAATTQYLLKFRKPS